MVEFILYQLGEGGALKGPGDFLFHVSLANIFQVVLINAITEGEGDFFFFCTCKSGYTK